MSKLQTPGFSPVATATRDRGNRFNGFALKLNEKTVETVFITKGNAWPPV